MTPPETDTADHAKVLRRWARVAAGSDLRTVLLASAAEIERLNDAVRLLAEHAPPKVAAKVFRP